MARYDAEHKRATRERILATAGRRFKQDGIDGSGVATLMKDAALTNGAFYAHFDSKDDLVAHVVEQELRVQLEQLRALDPGREGVLELLDGYLSADHRDAPAEGCPSAALLDEIARGPVEARRAYTRGLLDVVDEIGSRLERDGGEADMRELVLTVYALLIGAVQMSRALTDRELADRLLQQARTQALAMLEG